MILSLLTGWQAFLLGPGALALILSTPQLCHLLPPKRDLPKKEFSLKQHLTSLAACVKKCQAQNPRQPAPSLQLPGQAGLDKWKLAFPAFPAQKAAQVFEVVVTNKCILSQFPNR